MLDSSRKLSIMVSEMPRHGTSPSGSNHSCSPSPSICHAQLAHSELSQKQSQLRSPRRLPIPPIHASPSPTSSTYSSSTQSPAVSPVTPYHLLYRSYPLRPLPKMPKLPPGHLETPKHDGPTAERSPPPRNRADSMVSFPLPQRPTTSVEEIRRGNLSKLRRHLGRSVPPDLIPPKLERDGDDEASDSSSSGSSDEDAAGPASAPIRPAFLLQPIDERPIKRWEKKGRRWVAEDYRHILPRLRELR